MRKKLGLSIKLTDHIAPMAAVLFNRIGVFLEENPSSSLLAELDPIVQACLLCTQELDHMSKCSDILQGLMLGSEQYESVLAELVRSSGDASIEYHINIM